MILKRNTFLLYQFSQMIMKGGDRMNVKVKVIKRYHDLKLGRIQEKGTEFEVTKERSEYLTKQGMVEILKEIAKTAKTEGKE